MHRSSEPQYPQDTGGQPSCADGAGVTQVSRGSALKPPKESWGFPGVVRGLSKGTGAGRKSWAVITHKPRHFQHF